MRISLLEKREDFYSILKESLHLAFDVHEDQLEEYFCVNRYLNFVASRSLSSKTFHILKLEYSSSMIWWKKAFQYVYVNLAINRFFRRVFSSNRLKLSSYFSEYLILGGNHRLRLFNKNLDKSIVVLKSGERSSFIENDIYLRTEFTIPYAPILYKFDNISFEEEYFPGKPINRCSEIIDATNTLNNIIEIHYNTLLLASKSITSLLDYEKLVLDEIRMIFESDIDIDIPNLTGEIIKTVKILFSLLKNKHVDLSWTHGDFQEANILVEKNDYKVIDWEASSRRYYLYDVFVLLSEIRTNIGLKESLVNFNSKIDKFSFINIQCDTIIFFIIEELRFSVNENFSCNFYDSGKETSILLKQIQNMINNDFSLILNED